MFYRCTASYELITWPKDTFHRRGDVSAEYRRTSWIFMGQTGEVYFWWREQYLLNLLAMFGELPGIECVCVCVCVYIIYFYINYHVLPNFYCYFNIFIITSINHMLRVWPLSNFLKSSWSFIHILLLVMIFNV